MNAHQQAAFEEEMAMAQRCIREDQLQDAMAHLERAHVLGQEQLVRHARTHLLMLKVELRRWHGAAAAGQAVRVALGIVGNAIGRLPAGNIGSSQVNMFQPMPIARDLQEIMGLRLEKP